MSIFSKLFNSEKKDTTYRGERPYQSLLESTGGKDYYQKILGRMNGQGVGFGDNYASKYANPIVNNLRNNFESYTMPELTSELSVTGRRRGTGGFDQVRRAYNEQALTEGDVFSRLQQRNEDAQREDINNAIEGVGDFNQRDANTKNNYANFEYADNNRQVTEANQRRANQATGYQNLLNAGGDIVSTYLGGGSGTFSRQAPTVSQPLPNYSSYGQAPYGDVSRVNSRVMQRNARAGRIL